MNVGMWWKALRVIPRIDKEEWQRLDVVARWLISTRAAVLLMTFFSAAFAGLFALRDGRFDLGRWTLLALGLIFAHATNNLINDYTDFKRGVDRDNYFRTQYGPQPIEQGLMSQRELFVYIAFSAAVAIAAGIPLVLFVGPGALLLMAVGVIFVLFYTWPLKYIGLGEIAVLLIWGPLMVGGGYYVITGAWNWNVALASLAYALGPTTVLFGKHIDKLASDRARRIHTLPVILGEKAARYTVLGMIAAMYLLVIYLVVSGFLSPVLLIVLLALRTLPKVWAMYRSPKPSERPADYDANTWPLWFSAMSFYHNKQYGSLLMLGLILQVLIR